MTSIAYWIAVVAVVVMGTARVTRLVTFDHFPPVKWARNKFAEATDGSDWQLLAFCGYCASFWIAGVVVGWAVLAGVLDGPVDVGGMALGEKVWWLLFGTLGASYAAAMVMARDGDDS